MLFQETTYSVLLVTASEKNRQSMMGLLPTSDFYPIAAAGSIAEAKRILAEKSYDIIIINAPLPDDFGLHLAMNACSNSDAGVLLLVDNERYNAIYAQAIPYGVMTLSKPTTVPILTQTLRILCATRERMRQASARQATLEEKMEEIRLVNQAKWLLIQNLSMTEQEAHRYIAKHAMDLRLSKRQIAENIIKTYQ